MRMGKDKAGLQLEGQPLWRHQVGRLLEAGATEILISGRKNGPWQDFAWKILEDAAPGRGPLAGLREALLASGTEWVLCLAVDMPAMSAGFLRALVEESISTGRGTVPRGPNGWEPLAAVYPRTILALAEEALGAGRLSLQEFVNTGIRAGLLRALPVAPSEMKLFYNINRPADWLELELGPAPGEPS